MTTQRRSIGPFVHRKGGLYFAVGPITHTESHERLVVYAGLSHAGPLCLRLWARPESMFCDGRFRRPWAGLGARLAGAAQRAAVVLGSAVERAAGPRWGPFPWSPR